MNRTRHIVFLLNLPQDVNTVRPLAYLAARDLDVSIVFCVSVNFLDRDALRSWQREVGRMAADTHAAVHIYESPADAFAILQGKHGILIAASESTLSAHAATHNVMRAAPSSFLRVTLQHGYECVGFLQNREHVIAHGRNIRFAADVVCGWCEAPALTAMAASERPKLYVSGPPMLLNRVLRPATPTGEGLVCENLHSVRMKMTGDFGASFMDVFERFCGDLGTKGQRVTLRPHPGGMHVVKNKVGLPANVGLDTKPVYDVDLSAYAYGISAPSTVIFDMIFAGIPVAVWRDEHGIMDVSNYEGLTAISALEDWCAFASDAVTDRDAVLARQAGFISRLRMPVDRKDVHGRFARLLASGTAPLGEVRTGKISRSFVPRRIAFFANALIPTLQLSFLKPLQPLIDSGEINYRIITEPEIGSVAKAVDSPLVGAKDRREEAVKAWLESELDSFAPALIVCCRYSGPAAAAIADYAKLRGIPLLFHVDDDLLNIPIEIGKKKYLAHNQPQRLDAVSTLLKRADLVYCSTPRLRGRFRHLGYRSEAVAGRIYCSGAIINRAVQRPVTRIGYMGFDHAHDFQTMLPELVSYLRRNTSVAFELFGSIPKPADLDEFGGRIIMVEPVRNYEEFLAAFAARQWDIGLCPLAPTPFNAVKANTKWVEYTCAGAAVLATRGMVYDACCADGCGELLGPGEWLTALQRLTDDPALRFTMVDRAQAKVERDYSVASLRGQVLEIFARARDLATASATPQNWPHVPHGALAARAAIDLR